MAKKRKTRKSRNKRPIFRSRLAASWAAFFDRLGIKYQYRQKGYTLGEEKDEYRPTFYIPAWDKFIELKPVDWALDAEQIKTWGLLVEETEKTLLVVLGYAEPGQYNILPLIPYYKEGQEKCIYGTVGQDTLNTFSYGIENNKLYFLMFSQQDLANKKFQLENNFPLWLKWEIRNNLFNWLKSDKHSEQPLNTNIHALIAPLEKVEKETTLSRAYRAASRVRH